MNHISNPDQHLQVEIRAAQGRTEFRRFHHFAHLAGTPNPGLPVREMWMAEKTKLLSSALPPRLARDFLDRAWEIQDIHGMVMARSLALVAVSHGEIIAGLAAGPAPRFVRRFARAGTDAVRRAIIATLQIHTLAVEPAYRRNGVGHALLDRLTSIAVAANTTLLYVRADSATAPLEFFGRQGFASHTSHEPLEFTTHGLTATEPPLPATLFSRRLPSRQRKRCGDVAGPGQ